jgi:hypothetical protein
VAVVVVEFITAWDIQRMADDEIIGFHRDVPPFRAKRMNYLNFPELVRRSKLAPPPVHQLPAAPDIPDLPGHSSPDEPEFIDPDAAVSTRLLQTGRKSREQDFSTEI